MPLSTAIVTENTVSVTTGSCLLGMLSTGFLDFRCFHRECTGYGDSPLGGLLHGFLDSINIDPTRIMPKLFIVRGVIVDNMLVRPNNMLVGLRVEQGVNGMDESSRILRVWIALLV